MIRVVILVIGPSHVGRADIYIMYGKHSLEHHIVVSISATYIFT